MNAIASSALPDETAPAAEQMRALSHLIDHAMRMARVAVEQYEASVTQPEQAAAAAPRRQPDPGSLFIRLARVVLNGIASQSRLAAGLPIASLAAPRTRARQAPDPIAFAEALRIEPFRQGLTTETRNHAQGAETACEPVRQALRTATRNHPHGRKLLSAGLEHLAATIAANPSSIADLPNLLRRICNETGIHLDPSQWRRAARDLTPNIRAAPA